MGLDLRIPAERIAPPRDLELRPKQARAWVESLLLSQSAEAGRKILANLCAINRTKVEFDDRLQLCEAYRPVAQVVFDELDAVDGKSQHRFYCGVDLHARSMFTHVLDKKGKTVFEKDLPADPDEFLHAVKPFRKNIGVGCECMFAW